MSSSLAIKIHPPPHQHPKKTPLFSIKAMVDGSAYFPTSCFSLRLPQEQEASHSLPPERHKKPQEQVLSCYQTSESLPLETVPGNGRLTVHLDRQKVGDGKAT